jgi:hypothetical protein
MLFSLLLGIVLQLLPCIALRYDHYEDVRCNDDQRTYSRQFRVTHSSFRINEGYPHLIDYSFVLNAEQKDFGCNMFLKVVASTQFHESALGRIDIPEIDRKSFNVSLQLDRGKEWTIRITRECDEGDPDLGFRNNDDPSASFSSISFNDLGGGSKIKIPAYVTIPVFPVATSEISKTSEKLCTSTSELTNGHYYFENNTSTVTWRPNTCSIFPQILQNPEYILRRKWYVFIGDSTIQELALGVAAILTGTSDCLRNILSHRPSEKFTHSGFLDCLISVGNQSISENKQKQVKVKNLLKQEFSALAQKCRIPYMQWRDADLEWQGARVTWIWLGASGPCLNDVGVPAFEASERKLRIKSLFAKERKPDYLVLNSGLHDLVRKNFQLMNYSEGLHNMLSSLTEFSSEGNTKMIWKTTTATGKASRCPRSHGTERGTGAVRLLNEVSMQLALRYHFKILDVYPMRSLRSFDGDGHHCNADPSCVAQLGVFVEMIRLMSDISRE